MKFHLSRSVEVLQRTPAVLKELLNGISEDWTIVNEGGTTWSVYDVVGHLIHGEKTDWMSRLHIILSKSTNKTFIPFDRFAQKETSNNKSLTELLNEFEILRQKNVEQLLSLDLSVENENTTGIHPDFGTVTLAQLLATWTVHDLNHIGQICRVMAKQYKSEVGPWVAYLGILKIKI